MKKNNQILLTLIITVLLAVPVISYAGGPGFDKDVYTWGGGDDDADNNNNHNNNWGNDDDDDYRGGDDDDYRGGDDDDDYRGGDDDDDRGGDDIPLDGGLSFLAAAGAAFGFKKFKDNQKKNKE